MLQALWLCYETCVGFRREQRSQPSKSLYDLIAGKIVTF